VDPDFWLDKWRHNEIGFHQAQPHPALAKYWPLLGLARNSRVFVPLAGKSPDLVWLATAGHQVVGIELSPIAVAQFRTLTPAALGPISAVFDRASLIALPPAMRQRYAAHLAALQAPGTQTLLLSLEYDQTRMTGPPHSVNATEVESLFAATHHIEALARDDQLADFAKFRERGLDQLTEAAYRLQRL
jgi:thiopurine S-methyltransferase